MVVFPLFMTDKYYNIQSTKMYFYLYSTITATVLVAVCILFGKITGKWDDAGKKDGAREKKAGAVQNKAAVWSRIKAAMLPADLFAALFLLVIALSTAGSEWRYEAFWGNMGRSQGCFLWIWYFSTYLMISRFYEVRKWHIDLFLAASLVVCIWGILDCFWMSPFHWQELHENGNEKAFDFSSTIGNVNILTGLEGIYLAVASAMFIGEQQQSAVSAARKVFYFAASCAAFMALVCGLSDNAMISVAAVICFLPFYAFGQRCGIVKYLMLLAGYLLTMILTGHIAAREGQRIIMRRKWGQLLKVSVDHTPGLEKLLIVLIVLIITAGIGTVLYHRRRGGSGSLLHDDVLPSEALTRRLRIIWALLGTAAAAAVIYVFYDANTGGHPDLYAPYRKFLVFSDSWGTHRGYNWKLALKYFRDFPIWKKLFGSGPETYAIYTHVYDHYEMMDMFSETYDSPHNEWLQYLFTTGILGFVGYYGMVISGMAAGWTAGRKDKHQVLQSAGPETGGTGALPEYVLQQKGQIGAAFAYGVLAYTLQSFVNISVPITVPYVIMGIAVCASLYRCE